MSRYVIRIKSNAITEFAILILSMLYLSYLHNGIRVLVPLFTGTVAFGIMLLLDVFFLADGSTRQKMGKRFPAGIAIALVIGLFFVILGEETFLNSFALTTLHCLTVMLIASYYEDRGDLRNILLGFLLLEILLSVGVNALYMALDPQMIHRVNDDTMIAAGNGLLNMVNLYALYEAAVIYYIVLANFARCKNKIIFGGILVAIFYIILNAQMTILLLTTVFVTIIVGLVKPEQYRKTFLLIGGLVILVAVFSGDMLIWSINNQIFGARTTVRLQDIYNLFYQGNSISSILSYYGQQFNGRMNFSSVQGRLICYVQSLKAFCHNFFFGYLTPNALPIGEHSSWLDYIAEYGILIAVLYKSIVSYLVCVYKESDSYNKKAVVCFGIVYIVMGLINAVNIRYFFLYVYLLIPYLNDILIKKKV